MTLQEELRQIQEALTDILGTSSRWSGVLEWTDDPDIRGAKPFRCDIVLNRELAGRDARWRTMIHEMLHTFSAGYHAPDYQEMRGWEEGVVENLQRLLRPVILQRLGVSVSETLLQAAELDHDYNKYIAAIETLRLPLGQDAEGFYQTLLKQPLRERPAFVLSQRMRLPQGTRNSFVGLFSRADATLKRRRIG